MTGFERRTEGEGKGWRTAIRGGLAGARIAFVCSAGRETRLCTRWEMLVGAWDVDYCN